MVLLEYFDHNIPQRKKIFYLYHLNQYCQIAALHLCSPLYLKVLRESLIIELQYFPFDVQWHPPRTIVIFTVYLQTKLQKGARVNLCLRQNS